jgi:F-box/leucine-rich repeat protein 10/11
MTLNEWALYFDQPSAQREGILNVITLEISDSPLGRMIRRPKVVRDMDWIDVLQVIPNPNVQFYCVSRGVD